MNLSIPDTVRQETRKCCADFSCLTTGHCGRNPVCEVESHLDNNMLFVKAVKDPSDVSCSYTFIYGSKRVCFCPTRYSLFAQGHVTLKSVA